MPNAEKRRRLASSYCGVRDPLTFENIILARNRIGTLGKTGASAMRPYRERQP